MGASPVRSLSSRSTLSPGLRCGGERCFCAGALTKSLKTGPHSLNKLDVLKVQPVICANNDSHGDTMVHHGADNIIQSIACLNDVDMRTVGLISG